MSLAFPPMTRPPQRVVCAAARNAHGDIVCAPRHYDATMRAQMDAAPERWPRGGHPEQGFVDQFGTFLTREEAWVIAEREGQIHRRCGGDGAELFSENLY